MELLKEKFREAIVDKHLVTKIEIQKRNKERVNVYIDGEFGFACSLELIYTFNIFKGKAVDVEYLKSIIDENNYMKCKNSALKILERNYKTEKQMRDKLFQKQYDGNTVAKVIDFLKKYKFVDDDKFVEMYIKEKINSQGKNKIKYDLIKKGIDKELLDEKLSLVDSSFQENTAFNIARKKYETIIKSEKDRNKVYRKLGSYLLRKGYSWEDVKKVLNRIMENSFI